MKGKVPVWEAQAGWVGSPPPPPPSSVTGSRCGGGGRGMAGRVLPGNPEWGRGVTLASKYREPDSHLILARKNRGLGSHLSSASYFGKSFQQPILASQFGGVLSQVNSEDLFSGFSKGEIKAKKREVNYVSFRRPVMSHHRHCI